MTPITAPAEKGTLNGDPNLENYTQLVTQVSHLRGRVPNPKKGKFFRVQVSNAFKENARRTLKES